jgi:hypothetical protein
LVITYKTKKNITTTLSTSKEPSIPKHLSKIEEWFHKIRFKDLPKDSKSSKVIKIKTNSNLWITIKISNNWLGSKSIKDQERKEVRVDPEVDLVVAPGALEIEAEKVVDLEPIKEACHQI